MVYLQNDNQALGKPPRTTFTKAKMNSGQKQGWTKVPSPNRLLVYIQTTNNLMVYKNLKKVIFLNWEKKSFFLFA